MLKTLAPVAALLLSVAILLLGNGLQGTLLPVRAQLEEFTSIEIGILGSAYFVGFALGCLLAPYLIRRVGHIRAFTAMVSIASTVSLAHALILIPEVWWVFRGLTGFCFAGLYMVIESWLMEKSSNETRGLVFSIYTIINLTVVTAGQMLTAVDDPFNFPLFALASILVSLAAVPVALTKSPAPEPPSTVRIRPVHLFRISPVGLVGSVAVGLVNGAFWSLGPVFAQREEGNVTAVAIFMSLVVISGAVGQWPLGRASDRFDRRLVLVIGAAGAAAAGFGLNLASLYFTSDNRHPRSCRSVRDLFVPALFDLRGAHQRPCGVGWLRGSGLGPVAGIFSGRRRRPADRVVHDVGGRRQQAVHVHRAGAPAFDHVHVVSDDAV